MYSNDNGFTLIEFLVAIVIMMVGLLGLLQAVNVGLIQNLNTQLRDGAVGVADWHLAREMAKSFEAVSTTTRGTTDRRLILNSFKTYSVVRSGDATLANSKQVNVTVSWKHKNTRYTQEASTIISKYQ